MKILVFTEGTILMNKTDSVDDYSNYIPVGNAVQKLTEWKKQGAIICYLSSRRVKPEIEAIQSVLRKYNFPDANNLYFRHQEEEYKDVAEKLSLTF